MIKKSIGYLRNFVIKHKKLYPIIKELIVSDESVIILKKDNNFKVAGNVQSDAMAVYMLGLLLCCRTSLVRSSATYTTIRFIQ